MNDKVELGMDHVDEALQEAKAHGLEVEVVTWALLLMKKNPTLTIGEAIWGGYDEWIK